MNLRILYIIILIPYVVGLFIPLMEADSAQHATMAMRMAVENDFIHLIKFHQPYLDKPHMHFWLAAISFKIFGLHEWAYRLPAFLFLMGGAYATYRLGKSLYNNFVGHISTLIFLSVQTIILSAHDVRTDAVLTGATILGLWKIMAFIKKQRIIDVCLGFLFLGIAFSTKGLIAVIFVGLCVFCHLVYRNKWSQFFNWKLILGLLSFVFAISPMLYAYYHQFDLHPELVVEGNKNISGVRFILWDQVFNRLNASGFEETSPDYFFFFHTLLWAFIPFSILAYIALYDGINKLIRSKFKKVKNLDIMSIGGFVLMMILISFSKFKLPHYLNILTPVLAIVCGGYLLRVKRKNSLKLIQKLLVVQYVNVGLLSVGILLICFLVFKINNVVAAVLSVVGVIALFFVVFKMKKTVYKIVVISVVLAAWVNFSLNTLFYPPLLNYQGGKQIAEYVIENDIPKDKVFLYEKSFNWSLDFNLKQNTKTLNNAEVKKIKGVWLVVNRRNYKQLKEELDIKEVYIVDHFRITRLSLDFLRPSTRDEVLDKQYLIKL